MAKVPLPLMSTVLRISQRLEVKTTLSVFRSGTNFMGLLNLPLKSALTITILCLGLSETRLRPQLLTRLPVL